MNRSGLETIGKIAARNGASPPAPCDQSWRLDRGAGNDAAVDTAPRQLSAQPAIFDFHAAVLHHLETGCFGAHCRRGVANTELHPHHLGMDGDCVFDYRRNLGRIAKNVDNIDRFPNIPQRTKDLFAVQHLPGKARIDGNDAIAFELEIFHHQMARPVPIG